MAELNLYEYKVINNFKSVGTGLCFAETPIALQKIFETKGAFAISFSKKKQTIKNPIESFSLPFFKNLYSLTANSIDIITALAIVSSSFKSKEMKAIIENIVYNISSGLSLSMALAKFPKHFDLLTVKTIEIAEKTARLPEAMKTITDHIELNTGVKNEIKNSIRYPIILFIVIVCVTLFWIFFIVPAFAELFSDVGIRMPFITRLIVKFRTFCLNNYISLFVFLIILSSYFVAVFKCKTLRCHKNTIQKILPFVKTIKRDALALNFFSGMHVMLKEKLNLLDALDCVSLLAHSQEISSLKNTIKQGNSLSKAMKCCGIFNDSEMSIIEAGEQAGDLWAAFQTAETMLRNQISVRAKKIISLLQPVIVLFIGGLMLIVVYSVMIPMYSQLEVLG